MRDPDVVFRAQAAATALERAWRQWRVVHGLTANPAPAFSSYVGYSLEEPWGQPRVVLGLGAADAEQLTALLDRHDCVGPVHSAIVTGPAGRELPGPRRPAPGAAPGPGGQPGLPGRPGSILPLPLPVQVPRQRVFDDRDAPVFRQVAAAAREAVAHGNARAAAAAVTAGEWAEVVNADDQRDGAAAAGGGARADVPGRGHDDVPCDGEGGGDAPDRARSEAPADVPASVAARHAGRDADAVGDDGDWTDDDWIGDGEDWASGDGEADYPGDIDGSGRGAHARITGPAGSGPAGSGLPGSRPAGSGPARSGPAGSGLPGSGPAGSGPAGSGPALPQEAAEPGPLTLAAGAARVEAEARIKAALLESRWSAGLEYPYSGGSFDVTGTAQDGTGYRSVTDHPGARRGDAPGASLAAAGRAGQDQAGLATEDADPAGFAHGGAGPADDAGPAYVGPAGPADADPADADSADPADDEQVRPDHQGPGYARRGRITRGYSIPRLSRSRRSGALPGA